MKASTYAARAGLGAVLVILIACLSLLAMSSRTPQRPHQAPSDPARSSVPAAAPLG